MSANEIQHGGDHYKTGAQQHWDLMADNSVPYLEGNGSKYGYRWPKKNGLEDVQKFGHYVEKILEKFRTESYRNTSAMLPETWVAFCINNGVDELSTQATTLCLCWRTEEELILCLRLIDEIKTQAYSQ